MKVVIVVHNPDSASFSAITSDGIDLLVGSPDDMATQVLSNENLSTVDPALTTVLSVVDNDQTHCVGSFQVHLPPVILVDTGT